MFHCSLKPGYIKAVCPVSISILEKPVCFSSLVKTNVGKPHRRFLQDEWNAERSSFKIAKSDLNTRRDCPPNGIIRSNWVVKNPSSGSRPQPVPTRAPLVIAHWTTRRFWMSAEHRKQKKTRNIITCKSSASSDPRLTLCQWFWQSNIMLRAKPTCIFWLKV